MPIILKMSIMLEILIMPEMPEMPEILIINFAKVWNFGKVCTAKVTHLSYRKEAEKFGRREGEILMKKGCKEGGGSL